MRTYVPWALPSVEQSEKENWKKGPKLGILENNIFEINTALEEASYHIERNGNGKIIFTDLSIQLTRLIHKKELV